MHSLGILQHFLSLTQVDDKNITAMNWCHVRARLIKSSLIQYLDTACTLVQITK